MTITCTYPEWLDHRYKHAISKVHLTTWPTLEPHAATPAEALAALKQRWPNVEFELFPLPQQTREETFRQLELGYGA